MKTNRWLKAIALAMTVCMMMTALAIPAFAEDDIIDPYADFSKWDGATTDLTPFEGFDVATDYTGTDKHIEIKTAEQLAGLAKVVNEAKYTGPNNDNSTGAFKNLPIYVTANIDLCGHEFGSIGYQLAVANFAGLLEGRLNGEEGKAVTIANYTNLAYSGQNQGFIGSLRGGALKNFTFINAAVGNTGTLGVTGIAVGYACKAMEISGITAIDSLVIASEKSTTYTCGALVGMAKADVETTYKDMAAINVTIQLPMSGSPFTGGIVGEIQYRQPVTFENCYANINLCNAVETKYGFAAMDDIMVGGIVGEVKVDKNTLDLTLKNCHSNATLYTVSADTDDEATCGIGSLIGNIAVAGTVKIENCLSTAKNVDSAVIASAPAGVNLTVTNLYAVDADFVWVSDFDDSAYTYTTIAIEDLDGAAAQFKLAALDFDNVWAVGEDGYLPSLKGVADEALSLENAADDPVENEPDDEPADEPEDEPADEPEDEPADEPEDEKPATDDKKPATDDKKEDTTTTTAAPAAEEEKGCFGVISSTALVALMTLGLGVTVIRKKED